MFALGMSTMPDVLLLDEPVDGLDPIVRRIVWDFIVSDVAEREMTVLISSHNLREIEGICDTVGILSGGTMVLERDLDDLRSSVHKVQTAFRERPDMRRVMKNQKMIREEWFLVQLFMQRRFGPVYQNRVSRQ